MPKIKRSMMHKELRNIGSMIRLFWRQNSVKSYQTINRMQEKWMKGTSVSPDLEYEEKYIEGVRTCIYQSKNKKDNRTVLLWIHGGGYAISVPELDEQYIRRFVLRTDCVVIAPDYTKSLEAPYPKALHECYEVLKWIKNHSDMLKINQNQIFVGGSSAGGGLTAALAMYARDKNEVKIALQMPLYPMLDDRMITKSSIDHDGPVWNAKANKLAWDLYLKDLKEVSAYAAPSRQTNYQDLPPLLSFIGSIDLFYDETVTYVKSLEAANVNVHFKVFKGCFHAFEVIAPNKKVSQQAIIFLLDHFEEATKIYFKEQANI